MKFLKLWLCVAFFFSLYTSGFAQKKTDCKFETDNTSANGTPIRKIKTKLTGTDIFYITITRTDTAYTLGLDFWISGALKEVINKKDVATIKLSGWVNLVLRASQQVKPNMHYDDQAWSEYTPEYAIRAADLERLKDTKLLNLKLNVGIEPFFREFNEKDAGKIMDMVKCIMK